MSEGISIHGLSTMDAKAFEAIIRSRAARIAVGPSTVRGRGNRGTVAAARGYLRSLDLAPFGCSRAVDFARALDVETERLRRSLPANARHWGIARKVLNIFLRDCLYTSYLNRYNLTQAEELFELPLDSVTAQALKTEAGRASLPVWPGVKGVTPELNTMFQEVALRIGAQRGVARVHLDALWWSASRD